MMSRWLFNEEEGLPGVARCLVKLGKVSAAERDELSAGIRSLVYALLDSIHFAQESTLPPQHLFTSVGEILKTPMALSVQDAEFVQRATQL
eukprot:CAMPEP_0175943110 /NCGR_PEP_ID=MMETSP0108-20121206/25352_1 /TAXON_ID=195067 ORGANISM="Goniomonas pacifica, Strain CCMP1869" /NCGR_SAMPLE_ID=MMETSP0108 /ASSEMBLY_ACC=CAM_ASM_000204 /LENGTH=90 /DNA_ID=CAMNT_0017268001 /DNA_START=69 /DNA_END=338 /DNA_ORIENTATION=+